MPAQDQNKLFDVLAQQRQHQLLVDRVLKVVLPIIAFLLSVICANSIGNQLWDFRDSHIAFYAVGLPLNTLALANDSCSLRFCGQLLQL
jgi:hypothetical protein